MEKILIMRILIVSQYFWPENFRITDLAIALKERGHDVSVLTGMPNYPAGNIYEGYSWFKNRYDNMDGIPIYRVPLFARRKSKGWQLALNYLSFVLTGCTLGTWLLRKKNFDIVFTFEISPVTVGIPAILLSKIKKAPMFFWVQDLWPESLSATGAVKSPKILSAVSYMVKKIYKGCSFILVQSKSFIEPAVAVGAGREKIRYFPNWAEPLFKPMHVAASAKERREVPADGFTVMFAGNLGAAQSLDTIVNAANILKNENINWVFLGDGRQSDNLKKSIKNKKLSNIHLLGSRPLETMPTYFALADVMLVTLKDDPVMATTIPGKVQSYLASGKPIAGALNGAGAEIINNSGAGYCVSSGDSASLAKVILKMSNLKESELQEMGIKSLSYYKDNFDRDVLITKLETWMKDFIK